MFKRKYEPHVREDKVTIIDARLSFVFPLIAIIFVILMAIFLFAGEFKDTEDFLMGLLIIGGIFGILWLFLASLERRYTIHPDSITIRYGLFFKKIRLEKVDRCFYNSCSYITLLESSGKEATIDLLHIVGDVDNYFLDTIKNNNIRVRTIGNFEKDPADPNYRYKFKMPQKAFVAGILCFLCLAMILDIPFSIFLFQDDTSTGIRIILLVSMILYTALWFFLSLKTIQRVYVDGKQIEIHRVFRKPIVFNVNEISWVHTELRQPKNGGSYSVEEMDIHMKDNRLKGVGNISRGYKNYDLFVAFLHDNGVPFSLDETELYTYEKLQEEAEKDIPELLTLEDDAFTCDENYVIENGLFQGKTLDKELFLEGDYLNYEKKHAVMGRIIGALYILTSITFFIMIFMARVDAISILNALAIPAGLYILTFLVSDIDDLMAYKDITKDASCFNATVFTADVNSKDKSIVYAYDAGNVIRLIEPLAINTKLKQADYERLYNVPTYIWANPDLAPKCVEGTKDKPLGKGKYVSKIILLLLLEVLLVVGTICLNHIISSKVGPSSKDNANYESLMVDYEEDETAALSFPSDTTELHTNTYIWAADATSIYAFLEGGDEKYIGGHPISNASIEDEKQFLERAWDITDRDSAKETIDSHIKRGHQAKCRAYIQSDANTKKLIEALKRDFGSSFSLEDISKIDEAYFENNDIPTDNFYRLKGAACAYMRFGESGLAAYDYMRLIRIVYMCNHCGYLTDDEYMSLTLNLADAMQQQYNGFDEIHECYLYGEMFRLREVDDYANGVIDDINEALSAMNYYKLYSMINKDFDMDLTQDWKDLLRY